MRRQDPRPAGVFTGKKNSPVRPCAPCGEPSEPWIPESKLPPLPKDSVNSLIRNILLTNPLFPKFYADVVIASALNSHEANILAANYQKIIDRISMPTKTCTHIKVTGVRCGSVALRGEQFCYFHQHAHRGVKTPPQSRLHPIAILEDEESIQSSLMEVINALMRNTIDLKRAELILRALHIAVKNARRVKFPTTNTVKEIPDYAPATANVGTAALGCPVGPEVPGRSAVAETEATELDLPPIAAAPPRPVHPDPTFWENWEAGGKELARRAAATAHVGTAALGCPSGPDVPGRSAAAFKPPASVPSHDCKNQGARQALPHPSPPSANGNSRASQRKQPAPVVPTPKQRKNAAHSLP